MKFVQTFLCVEALFSVDILLFEKLRKTFLSIIEFVMQNHVLNIILCLILFETGVINQIRKTAVCFPMTLFEVVATFRVKNVYF